MSSASRRSAFTVVEMIVVIAIMGIALAVVGPSLILAPRNSGVNTVVADARRAALRRSEPVTLLIEAEGAWLIQSSRDGARISSGKGIAAQRSELKVDVSPLGLCTIDSGAEDFRAALNPFNCTFVDAPSGLR